MLPTSPREALLALAQAAGAGQARAGHETAEVNLSHFGKAGHWLTQQF